MTRLDGIGIAGFRSFSDQSLQRIDFEGPLTIIFGKNGAGKTTIIEVLKYITTGSLPPLSEKGKNFILDPKIANKSEVVAEARLKFLTYNQMMILAKRRAILTHSHKGYKFESIEQTLKVKNEKGEMFQINHQCAQIQKQIPQLLGVSKAVLQNIVFCHQDESLWPFTESSNLKNIFDELFETKTFSKIVDALMEKQKERKEYARENKKALDLLKRVNKEDNKRKIKALKDIAQVSKECEKIVSVKIEVKEMEQQLKKLQEEKKRNDLTKFVLFKKKGALEEKAKNCTQAIDQCRKKMKVISQFYKKGDKRELIVKEGQNLEDEIIFMRQKLTELQENKKNLVQLIEESKNMKNLTQNQIEITNQISLALNLMPQLQKQSLSEQEILNRIVSKRTMMENKRKELMIMNQQKDRIIIPNYLDLQMSQAGYRDRKQSLKNEKLKLQQITQKIMYHYSRLFQLIDKRVYRQIDGSIENKLREVQYKLKMMRQEIERYKNMPDIENINQMIFEKQFTGITIYDQFYCACVEKGKCMLCSKQVTNQELVAMKVKCDKIRNKTETAIEKLREKLKNHPEISISPSQMIRKITEDIEKTELIEKEYYEKYQQFCLIQKHKEQSILNDKLITHLRRVGLQYKECSYTFNETSNIEVFMDLINKYDNFKFRLQGKGKELKLYEERLRKNNEIEVERSACEQRISEIINKISVLEKQTIGFQILNNNQKQLAVLLKTKEKNRIRNKGNNEMCKEDRIEQLNLQLRNTQKDISRLTLEKDFYQLSIHLSAMMRDNNQMIEQVKSMDEQLKYIEGFFENFDKLKTYYNTRKMDLQSKKKELSLRNELAFNQYNRPIQREYLPTKLNVKDAEDAADDLLLMAKLTEYTVRKVHQDKMDEVNKIISEIWKEVYHATDIGMIEIQTLPEEGNNQKKNYRYVIMMQKQVGRSVKLEMKGRCSMGQKVLASIVIRLALAEVFATGVSILALDEPTTNLDRQHIENLALQIGKLMEISQRNQKRYLQLIIISHDLQFMKCLDRYTNHYYEVSRDKNQYSIITRKDIQEIYAER